MKFLKLSSLFIVATMLLLSCRKDENIKLNEANEVLGLQLIKSFTNNEYTVDLYNNSGLLRVGYNKLFLRITDKNGNYVKESSVNWTPIMTMKMGNSTRTHSCPFSIINKVSDKKTMFEGYIVFIMASKEPNNFWDLKINFTVNEQNVELHDTVNVVSTDTDYSKVYQSKIGTDTKMYMLALVEPNAAKVGTNDIVVGLFMLGDDDKFPIVNNYKIKVDPRMPGMNNHSAPGNEDLTQGSDGLYHGKVGFSMSGYWKINLMLQNEAGTTIAGEAVNDQTLESSLSFKLEF